LFRWMTEKQNKFFAKAAVDHLWTYFFGRSLLEPIRDEFADSAKHPELLDMLAKEFVENDYDLKHLIRAIVHTRAYQRSSRGKGDNAHLELYAQMSVRKLTPEQLYDSVMLATRRIDEQLQRDSQRNLSPQAIRGVVNSSRTKMVLVFNDPNKQTESQTSILQALFMMNGGFLANRIDPDTNTSLQAISTSSSSTTRALESLFLMTLSRPPTDAEVQRLVSYLERGGATKNPTQAVADICWALLNSSEFMLNY